WGGECAQPRNVLIGKPEVPRRGEDSIYVRRFGWSRLHIRADIAKRGTILPGQCAREHRFRQIDLAEHILRVGVQSHKLSVRRSCKNAIDNMSGGADEIRARRYDDIEASQRRWHNLVRE